MILSSMLFTSCGDDTKATSTETEAVAQEKADPKQSEVKAALKSQVKAVTSDLMVKVTPYIDVASPVYDIPEDLVGRDLVQVNVKWAFKAKEDLYLSEDTLHELESQPTVVVKKFSKGEEVDYVESTYVVEKAGEKGYILNRSQYTKQRFAVDYYKPRKEFGKNTLVSGSEEYNKAIAEVEAIEQAKAKKEKEEKLAKEEAKKAEELALKQAEEEEFKEKLADYIKYLQPGNTYKAVLPKRFGYKEGYPVVVKVEEVKEKVNRKYFTITINCSTKKRNYKTVLIGYFNSEYKFMLLNTEEAPKFSYDFPNYLSNRDYRYEIKTTGSDEIIRLSIVNLDDEKHGEFELMKQEE
jgi:anthranilate/para-aminobenzoate synthase component I